MTNTNYVFPMMRHRPRWTKLLSARFERKRTGRDVASASGPEAAVSQFYAHLLACVRRRWFFPAFIACLVVSTDAAAESRYQVVPLHPGYEFGTEKALILDTVGGHLWIWVESPAVNDKQGGRYVIYQGQLAPGREMGDIISEQHWPATRK